MATINIQEGTDTIRISNIIKEDKSKTDTLELTLPLSATLAVSDTLNYKNSSGTTIFSGLVQSVQLSNVKEYIVYDHGAELLQRVVNQIYTSQSPEAIIESVINNFTTLTYVSTISSGITIDTYVANKKRAWDIVTEMSEILLANFRVDKSKNFQLELEGTSTSSKTITTTNAVLQGKWNQDTTQLINSVTVDGEDRQIFERDPQLFSGTGSPQTITLAEIPVDIKLENPLGTILEGYVDGSTSAGDYTLDRDQKEVSGTFASGSNNIRATYTTSIPLSLRRRDKNSIDTYGQHDRVFKKPYIKTRDDLKSFASFILSRFSDPLLSSAWVINNITDYNDFESYVPNEVINVNDTIRSINENLIIRKIERTFPGKLKITVGEPIGDVLFWNKEVQQRVKQLEEKDDNATILSEDELISENLKLSFSTEVVFIKTRSKGSAWILDDATQSQLDKTFKLDGGTLTQLWP